MAILHNLFPNCVCLTLLSNLSLYANSYMADIHVLVFKKAFFLKTPKRLEQDFFQLFCNILFDIVPNEKSADKTL